MFIKIYFFTQTALTCVYISVLWEKQGLLFGEANESSASPRFRTKLYHIFTPNISDNHPFQNTKISQF